MFFSFAPLRAKLKILIKIKTVLQSFLSSEILFYAASLSFYTIFSLIPILLITLTIMTSLPHFENLLIDMKSLLFANLVPDRSLALSDYLDTVLQNGIKMGLMGVLYALFTSFLFYNNYEYIVSKIFDRPQKSFYTSLSTYLALILFTPIILAMIIFMTSGLSSSLNEWFTFINLSFQSIISFVLSWFMFFALMKVSSHLSCSNRAFILSALFTATVWYLAQKLFLSYIFANTTYASLYGSFSSILFFFLWIYFSWIIYLYGLKSTTYIEHYIHKTH